MKASAMVIAIHHTMTMQPNTRIVTLKKRVTKRRCSNSRTENLVRARMETCNKEVT